MNLKKLEDILPWAAATTLGNPYEKLIIPCLKESSFYDKGVGYFQSEWIDLAKDGLTTFVSNGGKIRLLTSIKVNESEFNAFKNGELAKTDQILKKQLFLDAIEATEKSGKQWTLKYLSWMISQNILDVKILVHKESFIHMYHDKLSFFSDGIETVCLNGSMNDSDNAIENEEIINVFSTWRPGGEKTIKELRNIYEYDWKGGPQKFVVLDLPEIVKIEYSSIQSPSNPYYPITVSLIKDDVKMRPSVRDYQEMAIQKLEENGFNGVLAMATGTGKTFTSLFAVQRLMAIKPIFLVCVVVPQTTLLSQWEANISDLFDYPTMITCAFSKTDWISKLASNLLYLNPDDPLFVLTTYKTLMDKDFQKSVLSFKKNMVYIFDECHKLGAPELIDRFVPNQLSSKIGLSATPNRWLDAKGSQFIEKIIGKTVYEYSMERAIKDGKLCHYNYHIVLCELTHEETQEFCEDTANIGKISSFRSEDSEETDDASLKRLLTHRARIAKKCASKWVAFFEAFSSSENKSGSIVYVFDQQIDEMVKDIRKRFPTLIVQSISAETPAEERKKILKGFDEGQIDVIVAIQCLDEGVDIPNCNKEFILASSTNPREFIQRRGRVLRKSTKYPQKIAEITDFVTIANSSSFYSDADKQSVIKRELPRVAEFIRLSDNKEDINLLRYLQDISGISLYCAENPWADYSNNEQEEEENG